METAFRLAVSRRKNPLGFHLCLPWNDGKHFGNVRARTDKEFDSPEQQVRSQPKSTLHICIPSFLSLTGYPCTGARAYASHILKLLVGSSLLMGSRGYNSMESRGLSLVWFGLVFLSYFLPFGPISPAYSTATLPSLQELPLSRLRLCITDATSALLNVFNQLSSFAHLSHASHAIYPAWEPEQN